MIANSQRRFTSVKSYTTTLIAFYDEMAGYVDKGKAVMMFFILASARCLTECPIISLESDL